MLKRLTASVATRVLRAAANRISDDIALATKLQACWSSAELVSTSMQEARACRSQHDVMAIALASTKGDGFVAEFGVYKGFTLSVIANHFSNDQVHGFDTFTGLPGFWRKGFSKGTFAIPMENVKVPANCVLHKGLFSETLPKFVETNNKSAKLIHIDCDMYNSTVSVFENIKSLIVSGTVIVFDEYFNYSGWQQHEYKAFNEFASETGTKYQCIAYNERGQQAAFVIV